MINPPNSENGGFPIPNLCLPHQCSHLISAIHLNDEALYNNEEKWQSLVRAGCGTLGALKKYQR